MPAALFVALVLFASRNPLQQQQCSRFPDTSTLCAKKAMEKINGKCRDAVIVLDPVTEWREVLSAVKYRDMVAIAITCNPLTGRDDIARFIPSNSLLREAGFDFVLDEDDDNDMASSPSTFAGFDVYRAAQRIKLLEKEKNIAVRGVIPLAETAVEYSDTMSALLGVASHNPLGTVLARRDKALMKEAVSAAGLRVAKFARVKKASDFPDIISELELEYPLVVKTPQGFSTTDVYVCNDQNDAMLKVDIILNSGGPDCRRPMFALVEEYIGGDEIAINIVASPSFDDCDGVRVKCTDVWLYKKTISAGSARYNEAQMLDPNDVKLRSIISYAIQVAKAVEIFHGMGHIEAKATYCTETDQYIDPCLIEVGARLSGGRKASLTKAVVDGWDPFDALIDAHCGNTVVAPPVFTPKQHARHLFLPQLTAGKITKIHGADGFDSLETYHSHFMLSKVGDVVERTTDITSCSGFVWLVGPRAAVEADVESVWRTFAVHTKLIFSVNSENEPSIDSGSSNQPACMGEVIPGLWVGNLSSLSHIEMIAPECPTGSTASSAIASEITVVTLLSSSRLTNFAHDCIARKTDELKSRGITIRHVVVELKDNGDPEFLSGPLPIALDAVDKALSSPSEADTCTNCLVHCAKGESRSVAVTAAYLMLRRKLSLQDALTKIRRVRPSANPNLGFIAALHAIEASNGNLHNAAARISAKK